jgi:hypothetical protein
MRVRAAELMEIAAQKKVSKREMDKVAKQIAPFLHLFLSGKEDGELEYYHKLTEIMNDFNIGIAKNKDSTWRELEKEFMRQRITDGRLRLYIHHYRVILEGVYSQKLFNLYALRKAADKNGQKPCEGIEVYRIDKAMDKVSKRIQELLSGEQPV